jgi:hypothetical protein
MTGRIKSLKNSSDSIGNRTLDLPAYSAVPQPTVPAHGDYFSISNCRTNILAIYRTIFIIYVVMYSFHCLSEPLTVLFGTLRFRGTQFQKS